MEKGFPEGNGPKSSGLNKGVTDDGVLLKSLKTEGRYRLPRNHSVGPLLLFTSFVESRHSRVGPDIRYIYSESETAVLQSHVHSSIFSSYVYKTFFQIQNDFDEFRWETRTQNKCAVDRDRPVSDLTQ